MGRERTFIAVKPDGVQRGLVGDIIKRMEQRGYKMVAMKMTQVYKSFINISLLNSKQILDIERKKYLKVDLYFLD